MRGMLFLSCASGVETMIMTSLNQQKRTSKRTTIGGGQVSMKTLPYTGRMVVVTLRHASILVQGAGESRDVGCVTKVEKLTLRRNSFFPTLLPFLSIPRGMLNHDPVVSMLFSVTEVSVVLSP